MLENQQFIPKQQQPIVIQQNNQGLMSLPMAVGGAIVGGIRGFYGNMKQSANTPIGAYGKEEYAWNGARYAKR